jgi:hypothetical protein
MGSRYLTVLRALEAGMELKIGHYTWAIKESIDTLSEWGAPDEPRPMLLIRMWNETKNEPHYINPAISVNDFMRLCEKLTVGEYASIRDALALHELSRDLG